MENSTNYKSLLNLVSGITTRLSTYEQKLEGFIEDISCRVLGSELKLNRKEESKTAFETRIHRKVDVVTNKVGNLIAFEETSRKLEEDIESINRKIDKRRFRS